ncbi:MAG TPA: phosphoribosylformylglycinamidine synthase, partial [Gammaproteobacteria bacterium]|nr:phosphoribosylformylglycinamidine synthase [Gammaproteobacteria bacterium]
MIEIKGPPSHSPFRLQQLLEELRKLNGSIEDLGARHTHFIDSSDQLTQKELEVLKILLTYGPDWDIGPEEGEKIIVIPRLGTISPWSSKATEIARLSGLSTIRRIERGIIYTLVSSRDVEKKDLQSLFGKLHDRMTQTALLHGQDAQLLFQSQAPKELCSIPLLSQGLTALQRANVELGLALSLQEMEYLIENFERLKRDPTDAELMMFAQANSEHCRHKVFNADWIIDGVKQDYTLFDMIKHTYQSFPEGILSAYKDNAAVMTGGPGKWFLPDSEKKSYSFFNDDIHSMMKVETHNHPTAISPFPGAATGSGGEIRDEAATGRGGIPKAGLTGFAVSHLQIPDFVQPWEQSIGRPDRIASALEIMIEGPIGGASFNNEFGRPNILGFFRTFETQNQLDENFAWGYHKPIMIVGGLGNISGSSVDKCAIEDESLLIVLGGPAMLIGLGGGSASSLSSGMSTEDLDYASVQRGNAELERRVQEVINQCFSMAIDESSDGNPILLIHDVGAGGLSNAIPEVVDHSQMGADLELRSIPNAEPGMAPLEIWCNEAQERYVLAIDAGNLTLFDRICKRERCPYAVVGTIKEHGNLKLHDDHYDNYPIDMPMDVLFGNPPQTQINIGTSNVQIEMGNLDFINIDQACEYILRFPTVADKTFLIHIGDRTVGGLVSQDQFVGPWQVPVSDVGVTIKDHSSFQGEAMAIGERTPIAILNPSASGRLAVGEAITNILSASIDNISDIKLSANWMSSIETDAQKQALYETVKAVTLDLCSKLGLVIPVGKDSLSMQTTWEEADVTKKVTAPLSLVVSAFAPLMDVRETITPELQKIKNSKLLLIDLGRGKNRLGGSCLSQVYNVAAGEPADLDDPDLLANFFSAIKKLKQHQKILAYHDRSDGGLFATLCEMSFAGKMGLTVSLSSESKTETIAALFSEELGAVIQINAEDCSGVLKVFEDYKLEECISVVADVTEKDEIVINSKHGYNQTFSLFDLRRMWSELSCKMQSLRDNPVTAKEGFEALLDATDPGIRPVISFDMSNLCKSKVGKNQKRPMVAILRDQGVNSHVEMAAAFDVAGFEAHDVHMTDILDANHSLDDFVGLVACGGFSYGDVLGAGGGWAKTILFHSKARKEFELFFSREDTFTLGVCNG